MAQVIQSSQRANTQTKPSRGFPSARRTDNKPVRGPEDSICGIEIILHSTDKQVRNKDAIAKTLS